jgi:hypothetical protein
MVGAAVTAALALARALQIVNTLLASPVARLSAMSVFLISDTSDVVTAASDTVRSISLTPTAPSSSYTSAVTVYCPAESMIKVASAVFESEATTV